MTRTEHLAWCKTRALEYVEMNKPTQAVASMQSDLMKNDDENPTREDIERVKAGTKMLVAGADADAIRTWVESFV
jgi:hypothetical protein